MLGFTGIDGLLILAPHRIGPIKLNNRVATKISSARLAWLLIECYRYRPYTITIHMKTIGNLSRDEIVLDPLEALRRGAVLDQMLSAALPPVPHGVTRGTHAMFQALDEQRMVSIAKKLNR